MINLFAQFEFAFVLLVFIRLLLIISLFPAVFYVGVLSDTETNKQRENSAQLSRDNSAHLARVLQLRQNREPIIERKRDEKTANAKIKNGKPKRYKCFLVDDNETEESLAQQKSYFANFQGRLKRPIDTLGWEEGIRQSAGAAAAGDPRYLYLSTKGTTPEPIIEYIDEDNSNETETDTTGPFDDIAEYSVTSLAPQRTTVRAMAPKQLFNSQITSAAMPLQRTSDEKQQEEDYGDEIGDDLYIIKTTRKPTRQEQSMLTTAATANRAQVKMPMARSIPGGALFDGGTNKIVDEKSEGSAKQIMPAVKIKASMRPFNVPIPPNTSIKAEKTKEMDENEKDIMPTERTAEETENQAQQLIRITPMRKGATDQQKTEETEQQQKQQQTDETQQQQKQQQTDETKQQQKQQQTDETKPKQQQMTAPAQNVQHDSHGRPLVLSPEHCKMVDRYSRLYGVKDVPSFVHNNCTFAKLYLPTATCAEIDILIASCYHPRSDRQQKQNGRH